jgi:hypothetical protein
MQGSRIDPAREPHRSGQGAPRARARGGGGAVAGRRGPGGAQRAGVAQARRCGSAGARAAEAACGTLVPGCWRARGGLVDPDAPGRAVGGRRRREVLVPSLELHGNSQAPQCRTLERRFPSGDFLDLFSEELLGIRRPRPAADALEHRRVAAGIRQAGGRRTRSSTGGSPPGYGRREGDAGSCREAFRGCRAAGGFTPGRARTGGRRRAARSWPRSARRASPRGASGGSSRGCRC